MSSWQHHQQHASTVRSFHASYSRNMVACSGSRRGDGKQARKAAGSAGSKYALASRSLIGEGRQYIRALNEAFVLLIEGCAQKEPRPENTAGTEEKEEEAAAAKKAVGGKTTQSGNPEEAVVGAGTQQGIARRKVLSLALLYHEAEYVGGCRWK